MKKSNFIWVYIIALLLICTMFSACNNSMSKTNNNEPTTSTDTINSSDESKASDIPDDESNKNDDESDKNDDESDKNADISNDNETKGAWTYYINEEDNYSIYKKNSDGSQKTKLSDDERVITLCVKGDNIYYTILDPDDGVPKLLKINADGSDRKVVCYVEFLGDVSQENITSSINGNSIFFKVEPLRQPTNNEIDKKNEDKRINDGTHTYEVSLDKKSGSGEDFK